MTITITDGTTSLPLPDDLMWPDEYAWNPVEQSVRPSVTGALIIDVGTWLAGRPITLEGERTPDGRYIAWLTGSDLTQLRSWADVAGQELTLTLRGIARTVIFRHHEKPAVEVIESMTELEGLQPDDLYLVRIKLMEI